MSRPITDAQLRRQFRELPQPLRDAIVGLRRAFDEASDADADKALDVCSRMLGKVWQRVTPAIGTMDACPPRSPSSSSSTTTS